MSKKPAFIIIVSGILSFIFIRIADPPFSNPPLAFTLLWITQMLIYTVMIGRTTTPNIEPLADLEHRQWAHWTKYMLENLSPENIARWKQQTETPYNKLTEKEKESDREWARKAIELMR